MLIHVSKMDPWYHHRVSIDFEFGNILIFWYDIWIEVTYSGFSDFAVL